MKKTKIVYINTFFHYSRPLTEMKQDEKWFYLYGMGHFLAWELIKRDPDIMVENWRADHSISKKKEKFVEGIMCRVFPSKKYPKIVDFSIELVRELKTIAREYDLIVHFLGMHNLFYHYIAWKLKKCAIVATHLGGGNPYWKYTQHKGKKSWVFWKLEKKILLNFYDHIFCQTDREKEYLSSTIGNDRVSKTAIFGVDFTLFQPIPKKEARQKLGFPQDKKIILQVGRAVRVRGVDIVLDVWKKICSKDLFLYMVDAHPEDELFPMLIESGVPFCGTVNFHELPLYYSAADVLIYLPFDDESLNFAGTSYVPLEAMACDTPVVAATLCNFPDDEIYSVCRVPTKKEQVTEMVLDLLQNPPDPWKCRSLVQKHYDWDTVISKHLLVYERLIKEHSTSKTDNF